ncbi:glycosyltransferase [Mucilaginibacter sp. PAMB04274]|uniref:glycosyltransferase n=1 Tax=Mucilaginibacter sp. PAMB04274 TaxID=3138568 RepID=UPI00332B870B
MPRFAKFLAEGMQQRGHEVEVWTPKALFYKVPVPASLKKWLGYIDQYLVFPSQTRARLKALPANTLFVFADHALGPWVPLVAHLPHVIHCHDFLAQKSALGLIPENPTSSTGKKYQKFIGNGYKQGKNFISVSNNTRQDLHQMLGYMPRHSKMVYNGLTQNFSPQNRDEARSLIERETGIQTQAGYLLHIGGNQWYKNRVGVIKIYNAWRKTYDQTLPLLMVGAKANAALLSEWSNSPYQKDIHLLSGRTDDFIKWAYNGASVFLFPSLAEGFGWPIAEAMASGCPVITTDEVPMTEVGGSAAFYIPRKRLGNVGNLWATEAAAVVNKVINLSPSELEQVINNGLNNGSRFSSAKALNQIEEIYKELLNKA